MSARSFSRFSISTRAIPELRAKIDADLRGSSLLSNATAAWAAKLGTSLQTSTLKFDETGESLHLQQAVQIRASRVAWKQAVSHAYSADFRKPQYFSIAR
jgi:hypothetical protein